MIEKILSKIGLEPKEIEVYLAAVELGTQPASLVARRTGIPRNTARFILDKLVDKGLMTKTKRANTQLYIPEQPENILRLIEMKRSKMNRSFDRQVEAVKEVMAELQSRMQSTSARPKITFYEGEDGLIKVYEDTLTSQETIRSFASFDAMHGVLPEYFTTYYHRRVKSGIFIRSIHPDTPLAREMTRADKEHWRESRLVDAAKYDFQPEIQLYDNKLAITSLSEKLGIIIESEWVYRAMVVAFELAWQEATRIDPRV